MEAEFSHTEKENVLVKGMAGEDAELLDPLKLRAYGNNKPEVQVVLPSEAVRELPDRSAAVVLPRPSLNGQYASRPLVSAIPVENLRLTSVEMLLATVTLPTLKLVYPDADAVTVYVPAVSP